MSLVRLLILVIVFGLIYWAITLLPIPQPFKTVALVILILILVLLLLNSVGWLADVRIR